MVSYHSTKFGGHRHCSSEDIKVLVCQVISQDHLIKGSFDFMGKSHSQVKLPSCQVWWP